MHTTKNYGDMVSVDQMIFSVPNLIAQSTGQAITKRHYVATVFVDHASNLNFIYMREHMLAEETLLAKQAFKKFAAHHNV